MSIRRAFLNFSFLTTGKTVGDAFTFLMFVVLSRVYGQEGIGQYSFAIGLTGFLAVIANFGLSSFLIKELNRRLDYYSNYYGQIFSFMLILSFFIYVIFLIVILFLPISHEFKLILVFVGAYQVIYKLVEGITSVFLAREDMHLFCCIEASLKAVLALGVIVVIFAGGSFVMALSVLPAATAVQTLIAYKLLSKKYGRVKLTTSTSFLRQIVRKAIPYALSGLLSQIYTRVDVVFLGIFIGVAAAGVYNVGYRVVFLLMFIPQFVAVALYPQASRLYPNSLGKVKALYHKSLRMNILLGLPIASVLWLIAPDLIVFIFGEAFSESASVLRLLCAWLFLTFLSRIMGIFLISCDQQVARTKSQGTGTCVNVVGNLLLIPAFGIMGAAIATFVSEMIMVILFAVRLRPILGWPRVGSRLAISSVGVASFCLLFTFFPSLSLGIVIPASVLIYLGTLALFKRIRRNEFRILVSILKKEPRRLASTAHEVS